MLSIISGLKIVAFHDPGDLLGFKGSYHLGNATSDQIEFYELTRRNTPAWLLFSRPSRAHATEDEFEDSISFILCGAENKGSSRLRKKKCW